MEYETIIGLEIHVQLKTRSKMFCSSPNNPDATEPNINICEVCTGQPGSLPAANKEAIRKGIMVGLALNCEIPEFSKFDRKNYFYPDLPKGYQISQYDQPICKNGWVEIKSDLSLFPSPSPGEGGRKRTLSPGDGERRREVERRRIRITRAHLEEDAGKLIHEDPSTGPGYTLVDFNRAGVPLLEIVTEPDFRSAEEAKLFLQNLRNTIRYLGVSDADMEKGHMRCDANISLRPIEEQNLPSYKVEIKNLNSFKAVEAGLNFEISRQTEALESGERLINETRGWDEAKGITVGQRTKEEAHDYRYFPEPDLPVLHFDKKYIDELRSLLPELPEQKLARFISEFALPVRDAEVLVNDKELAGYFEEVVSELQEWMSVEKNSPSAPSLVKEGEGGVQKFAKLATNWIIGDFQALLKNANLSPQESKITAENLAELIKMIERGEISVTAGKRVLEIMFQTGGDPSNIVEDEGVEQVSDEAAIATAVEKVIAENPKVVTDYQSGKKQALGVLVGKVMSATGGKANPQVVNRVLEKRLIST